MFILNFFLLEFLFVQFFFSFFSFSCYSFSSCYSIPFHSIAFHLIPIWNSIYKWNVIAIVFNLVFSVSIIHKTSYQKGKAKSKRKFFSANFFHVKKVFGCQKIYDHVIHEKNSYSLSHSHLHHSIIWLVIFSIIISLNFRFSFFSVLLLTSFWISKFIH